MDTEALQSIEGLLLDVDGVLRRGTKAIPGAANAVERLQRSGIDLVIVSNNSRFRSVDLAGLLADLGMRIAPHKVLTAAEATARHISELDPNARVHVVGSPALHAEVEAAGLRRSERPDYVVIGIDLNISLQQLSDAARLVRAGAALVASNPDLTLPVEDGLEPETGSMLAFMEAATSTVATVVGKPSSPIFAAALGRIECPRNRVAMVGDTPGTDIIGAQKAGIRSVLVGGEKYPTDLPGQPDHELASLAALADLVLGR